MRNSHRSDCSIHKIPYLTRCLAFLLCVVVILGIVGIVDMNVFAINYNIVEGWRLTDSNGDGNYGEVLLDYSTGNHLTATISLEDNHVFENMASSAAFAQEMNEYLTQHILGKFGVRIYLKGWSAEDTRENSWGSSLDVWEFYEIENVAFVANKTLQKNENITAVFEITCNTKGNSFMWPNTTDQMRFFISVSGTGPIDPNVYDTYEGITKWQLIKADGSKPESDQGASTITLPEKKAFDSVEDAKAYAEQLIKDYPRLDVQTENWRWLNLNLSIQSIEYDHTDVTGSFYKITTHDVFIWDRNVNSEGIATFYIMVPDPTGPQENLTQWRLMRPDGSAIEAAQGASNVIMPERIDFHSRAEAEDYADWLFAEYSQFSVKINYGNWQNALDILNIEFDNFTSNGARYRVTTNEAFRWHADYGGQIAQFFILVPNNSTPLEIREVTGWRLVLKGTNQSMLTVYDAHDRSQGRLLVYPLPDIIADDMDLAAYADVLFEKYDLQVSFDEARSNSSFSTVDVVSIYYQDGYLLIDTFNNYFFKWSNEEMHPRVTVRTESDPERTFNNPSGWNLSGNDGDNATVGKNSSSDYLQLTGWDFDNEVEGKEEDFAEILRELYPYLLVKSNVNDNEFIMYASEITGIEYDKELSDRYEKSFRKVAFFKVKIVDTCVGVTDFYILVMGKGNYSDYVIEPKDPDGIRMNLFDYWIVDGEKYNESGNPWDPNNWEKFDGGINANHALKFFNQGYSNEDNQNQNKIGRWNHSTVNTQNMVNIVQSTLSWGYPQLNLGDDNFYPDQSNGTFIHSGTSAEALKESLDYLFDPTRALESGKESYASVTGLFQRNDNGYYYYDSKLNFAEFDELFNSFILYNTWGVASASDPAPDGQFFPFNTADDVFKGETTDPKTGKTVLEQYTGADNINARSDRFNHFFGFTMEIDFQQPVNGKVGDTKEDMVFRFSGDDDVWIFVDGVLVLDLGGVHSGVYGEINFATGAVVTGKMDKNAPGAAMQDQFGNTNLRDIFTDARVKPGMENDGTWNGNTFASDTLHTIKIFYMERGHYDSNLAMYFNLQARVPHKIYKVDEDGNPLAGAAFSVYAAEPSDEYKNGETYHSASEFVPAYRSGTKTTWDDGDLEPLNAGLVTGADGYVTLSGIDFASRALGGKVYYFIEETSPAPGHRVMPERLVVEFIPDTNYPLRGVFRVLNQYEVGAYASFSAILEDNDDDFYYATAEVDPTTGDITFSKAEDEDGNVLTVGGGEGSHQESAMLFAVPMIYTNIGEGPKWYPIYGSNTNGYHVVDIYSNTNYTGTSTDEQSIFRWVLRHNLLAAAIRQVADVAGPDWYFHYDTLTDADGKVAFSRFTAELNNLPGEKDRYLLYNSTVSINGADLRLVGLLVDAESIMTLIDKHGGTVPDNFKTLPDQEKYLLLQNALQAQDFETQWDNIYNDEAPDWTGIRSILDYAYVQNTEQTTFDDRGVNLAYIDDFTRYYGSVFYIPNERRELRVLKQDPMGNPLEGAEFGLFESFEEAAKAGGTPIATGTTGTNGILIFGSKEDKSPANQGSGFAEMNWDGYNDTVWLKELTAPDGFVVNEAIVQIYVGKRTIYANASAFRANAQNKPEMIDDPANGEGTDGVTVLASVGKLFQSMEKFADSLLNSTLLDIDGRAKSFIPDSSVNNPDAATWTDTNDDLFRLHFWDRRELRYTSSDYSTAHKKSADGSIGGEAFAEAQHGYLQVHPTQTPKNVFESQHAGEIATRDSRRESLFDSNGTPIDLYNVFSPVNVVVIRNEYEGDADLRITKIVKGDAPEAKDKEYTFLITGPEETAGETYELEGATEISVTFPREAPYTVEVTVVGAGTAILKNLPAGVYTVEESLEGTQIAGYQLEVSYSADQVTVENGKTAVLTITNIYLNEAECSLTITDGGYYGEEDCGEEDEIFLYKVTGRTTTGEEIELIVSVPGGGSTTIIVPPGYYIIEEQPNWSWKYKNKKTVGDAPEEEWTISKDWITAKRQLRVTEEKEVVYSHERSDKTWQGDEASADNLFDAASDPADKEPERDPQAKPVILPLAIEEERKDPFPADEPDQTL